MEINVCALLLNQNTRCWDITVDVLSSTLTRPHIVHFDAALKVDELVRLGNAEKVLAENAPEREIRHWEYLTGRTKIYPYYEEPAYFIKIKEL